MSSSSAPNISGTSVSRQLPPDAQEPVRQGAQQGVGADARVTGRNRRISCPGTGSAGPGSAAGRRRPGPSAPPAPPGRPAPRRATSCALKKRSRSLGLRPVASWKACTLLFLAAKAQHQHPAPHWDGGKAPPAGPGWSPGPGPIGSSRRGGERRTPRPRPPAGARGALGCQRLGDSIHTANGGHYPNLVAYARASVRAQVALERGPQGRGGPGLLRGVRIGLLAGKLGGQVVAVHPLPWPDGLRGPADGTAVLDHILPKGDGNQGKLVPRRHVAG